MAKEYTFKGLAYICGSYQDRQRCDVVKVQFDASQKVEVAKLNLLGTDLKTYDPVLLEFKVKRAKALQNNDNSKEKTEPKIKRRKFKG